MQPHNILNGTPPCQNIMFPPLPLYNYNENNENYNKYQPIINIPTRTSTTTLGEVGASVELVRAHVSELSKRMESIEYKFSEFEKRVSNDVSLLKNTLLEHSTELLKMGDSVDSTLAHVKSTNDLIEQQDACIDKLTDAFYEQNRLYNKRQQQQNGIATNIDLGMIRRRLSKVEEFTKEFYDQFENFKEIKDIISGLSDHVDECDQEISNISGALFQSEKCQQCEQQCQEEEQHHVAIKYDMDDDHDDYNNNNHNENKNCELCDDDFEKLELV